MKICYNSNIMIDNKTNTETKELKFYKNYTKYVLPKLKELEIERKKELSTAILLSVGVVVVFTIFFAILLNLPLKEYDFFISNLMLLGVVLFSMFPIYFIWVNSIKVFNTELKKRPQATVISNDAIIESNILGRYNRRVDDDTFEGKYKDLHFAVSESDMQNIRGYGKNRNVWPVFDGVIVSIDSNKTIKNKTIITTKGDINVKNSDPLTLISIISIPIYLFFHRVSLYLTITILLVGLVIYGLIKVFWNKKQTEILDKMILEDPEFNNKYDAYSSNQVEGRYLVTTAFMERFKNLHTIFGSKKAKCSFFRNKVMFAITTNKNLFEIGDFFHPLTDMKHINKFMEEISAIYDIIDYFKLDEKTGL